MGEPFWTWQRIQRHTDQERVHTHKHTRVKYFTRCFWYSHMAKGQNKNSYLTTKMPWCFFPLNLFNTKWLLTPKAFPGSGICAAGRQMNKWCLTHSIRAVCQHCRSRLLLLFKSDTMTTHFRDHVYFAESHILNTGLSVERGQLMVQPCLCSK